MKRLPILSAMGAFVLVLGTSCLKDKGFDDGQYGITITDTKAVAFPTAAKSPLGYGLEVSASNQLVSGLVQITLETSGSADGDVVINLTNTSGTVAAGDIATHNTANSDNVQILPTALYTIPASVTIASGQKNVIVPINISNTTSLNPNLAYGIGITISSATNGYQVAQNQRKVLVKFSVKNKYDGVYRLQGYHNRVPYTFPYDTEMHLETTGPSSVIFYWPEVSSVGHPIGIGANNSMSWYGATVAPAINFDPATDLVVSVVGTDPAGPPITMFTGAGSRVSRFNPATRAITVDWNYNGNPLRAFFDDMTYIGPR
jgi:Domain of unknown function (DUF1735)